MLPLLAFEFIRMEFPERLATLRKARGLTQRALAEKVDVHLTQIQRYENGSSQPTLEIIRKLAVALSVSAVLDSLILKHEAKRVMQRAS